MILGDAFGRGAQVHIRSPLFYLHWQFATGARVEMPAEYPECEIHVTTGAIAIDRQRFETGQMLVLVAGQPVIIRCHLNALCGCMRRDIGLAERR